MVCRRTGHTGTLLGGEKECMTRAQWRERESANAEAVRTIQDRSRQTGR